LEIEDGLDGLRKVISRLPANTKANVVRIFADGDYVIAHSELNALVDKVASDFFRFESGKIVEHWAIWRRNARISILVDEASWMGLWR